MGAGMRIRRGVENQQGEEPDPLPSTAAPYDWMRLAIIAWTIILVGVSIRILIWPQHHNIFPIFAGAGQDWVNGEDLYFVEPSNRHRLDHFRYSPLVAALLVPFGLLPEQLGSVLWRLVNAGTFLGALVWWLRV